MQFLESQASNKQMIDELEAKNQKISEQDAKIEQQKKSLTELNTCYKQE